MDASGSLPGTGSINGYTFDFGDGSPTYTETPGSAPDGAFDGQTDHVYPTEGDFSPSVLVTNTSGLSNSDSTNARVGFGDDVSGAVAYVSGQMNTDYTQTLNQDIDLYDPVTKEYVPFVADIFGESASFGDIYVFYDWDRLTAEQQTCLTNRAADGRVDPTVIVIGDNTSPNTIDSLLSAQGALKSLAGKSANPVMKDYGMAPEADVPAEPVEPEEVLEVF